MGLDASSIAEGVLAGLGTHHLTKLSDEKIMENDIHEMLLILRDLRNFVDKYASPTANDVYEVVRLYKLGQGPSMQLQYEHRKFTRIMAPVPTAVLVNSIIGSPFVMTVPAPTPPNLWLPLDFPDGTMYSLDSTATANQMNVYVRYTNDKPAY